MSETIYSSESQLRSPGRFLRESLSDLRSSREVAWHLFARNLRSQYRQSFLGYLWILLPPLATSLLWMYLNWTNTLAVGHTDMPYPIYVLTGTMLWQLFSDALYCPLTQLGASRNLITKVRLPHEAILISGIGSILFNFAVRFAIVFASLLFFHIPLTWGLLLVPVGVIVLILLGLTIGLLLAPFGLLYNDVTLGLSMIMGFAFFMTPVVYPLSSKWPASLLSTLNPVASVLESTRNWLALGPVAPTPEFYIVTAVTLVLFVVGWLAYRMARPHLVARL